MSTFLGPIHYMMYEKIKFQDKITEKLLDKDKLEILNEIMPPVSRMPLDEIIDQDNIHGYLSSKIDIVEIRLHYAILHGKDIYKKVYDFGKSIAISNITSIEDLFNKINEIILDGMPCDNALTISYDEDNNLNLITNIDTHEKYFLDIKNIDPEKSRKKTCIGHHHHDSHESFMIKENIYIKESQKENHDNVENPYYILRENLLKGFLDKVDYSIERIGKNFLIKKIK